MLGEPLLFLDGAVTPDHRIGLGLRRDFVHPSFDRFAVRHDVSL
jgi:hypothetical protein